MNSWDVHRLIAHRKDGMAFVFEDYGAWYARYDDGADREFGPFGCQRDAMRYIDSVYPTEGGLTNEL